MPSGLYACAPAHSDPLCQVYESIREYMLDLLSWIRNVLNDVWDYFAQVRTLLCLHPHRSCWALCFTRRRLCADFEAPIVMLQVRPIDAVKKDDDLWSPRQSQAYHQPFFTGLGSESAFLSHFLPAPGNHPLTTSGHLSSSTLRADLQRTQHTGTVQPMQLHHACCLPATVARVVALAIQDCSQLFCADERWESAGTTSFTACKAHRW